MTLVETTQISKQLNPSQKELLNKYHYYSNQGEGSTCIRKNHLPGRQTFPTVLSSKTFHAS